MADPISAQRASGTIYVYRPVAPGALVEQRDVLAKTLFNMASANEGERRLHVSPMSGCLTFADYGELWSNTSGTNLPEDAQAVEAVAREFFQTANRSVAELKPSGDTPRLPPPFPQDLRIVSARLALAPDQLEPDHWLIQFMAFLPTGDAVPALPAAPSAPIPLATTKPGLLAPPRAFPTQIEGGAGTQTAAPVDGGIVELRIGAAGRIIGLWSRWRPCPNFDLVPRLPPPESDDHDDDHPPLLVYQMAGDDEPQPLLAPYYLVPAHGEHAELWPASSHSLVIYIGQETSGSGARLTAVVGGGSGQFRYAWGFWRPGADEILESAGESESLSLDAGVYDVMLDVRDERTGAFIRTQAVVHAGIVPPPPPTLPQRKPTS